MAKFNVEKWLHIKVEPTNEEVASDAIKDKPKKAKVTEKSKKKVLLLIDEIKQQELDITAKYEDWIKIAFALYNMFGDDGLKLFHEISKYHEDYSVDNAENVWKSIVNCSKANMATPGQAKAGHISIINIGIKYGIDAHELYKESIKEDMNKAVMEVASFRYNTLLNRYEYRYNDDKMEDFEVMSERALKTIFIRAQQKSSDLTLTILDAIICSEDNTPDYDPLMIYLNSLPKWDENKPDYIKLLFEHIQFVDEEYKEFYLKFLKKWFVCMVALGLGEEQDNQIMPVLIGEQQVGKTYFAKNILPPELVAFFHTVYPGDRNDKDQMLLLSESLIVNYDEFIISNSKVSGVMKSIISSIGGRVRDSYGHFREHHKRRCSFMGTSNDVKYIYERAGDRRYLSVLVKSTTDLNKDPLPYAGAYAQAWYYVQTNSFNYHISKAEAEEITKHNEPFVLEDLCETLINVYYRKPEPTEEGIFVSVGEILEKLHSTNHKVNPTNIGKAMNNLGFESKRPRNKVKYYVVEVKKSDRDAENKKEGKEYHDSLYGQIYATEEVKPDDIDPQLELDF